MYKYGMRLRELSPGCQPKDFEYFKHCDKRSTGYWSYVWYSRKLTENELLNYNMDYLKHE